MCSERQHPTSNSALFAAEEPEHRRSQPADETATASTSGQDGKAGAGEGKEQQKPEEQLADHELHQIGTFAQVSAVPSGAVVLPAMAAGAPLEMPSVDFELTPQEGC